MSVQKRIIVLGDLHFPFHRASALEKVLEKIKELKPDYVVQIGDLYDFYCFSRYNKKINYITPARELADGRRASEAMWKKIQEISPKTKCFQILGNHDERISKRVAEKLPEIETLLRRSLYDLYTFNDVVTLYDSRDELHLEGLIFQHGYLSQLGAHMQKNSNSTIVGHSHTAGIKWQNISDKNMFELNVGYLADSRKMPLQYGEAKRKTWTLGYGELTKEGNLWQPKFHTLE